MKASRKTKRALIPSILAVILCVAMLIGTTFAWFTDTASTSVNKIQAGNLDVALEVATAWETDDDGTKTVKTWETAEGKTLEFEKASSANGTTVLWEPGCTYELPELRIVNNGNLDLKYKIVISGIGGDAELNKVIDWTMMLDGSDVSEDVSSEHKLYAAKNIADGDTTKKSEQVFTISGTMDTTAGNEYQGKSIDNIAITVYATQLDSEFDSFDNTYDAGAMYPLMPKVEVNIVKEASVSSESKLTQDVKLSGSTIPEGTVLYTDHDKTTTLTTEAITGGKLQETITTTADSESANAMTVSISYNYIKTDETTGTAVTSFSTPITHTLSLSKGLSSVTVKHGNTNMEAVTEYANLADGKTYYNKTTGTLYIMSSTYSNFYITIAQNFAAAVGGQGYDSFADAVNAAKDGQTITLLKNDEVKYEDYNVDNRLKVTADNVTIDLCKNTLTVPNYTLILDGNNITLKNGEMKTTTVNSSQTNGSYAVVPWGKNITIDGVKMLGGVNVTGDNSNSTERDTTVKITNCEITATNYYTVCAQSNAEATIENTKLIGGAGTFFWVEEKGYSEGGAPLANVSSKIIYDAKTVEFSGNNALYNPVGVAVVVKNLTVKDAAGEEQTIDAVAVSTEAHLRTLVAAGENVMLASDITLSSALEITKTVTIVGNEHKLTANYNAGNGGETRVINVNENTNEVTLALSGVKVGDGSVYRGISVYGNSNVTLVLDNCEVSADHYAINIASGNTNPKVIVRNTTFGDAEVKGYCAFQTWSANTTATFENCTLIGNNKWGGSTDDFATIVTVNSGADDAKNSMLTFKNCTIKAYEKVKTNESETPADEKLLDVRTSATKVTFEGCSFFLNDTELTGNEITNEMKTQNDTDLAFNPAIK